MSRTTSVALTRWLAALATGFGAICLPLMGQLDAQSVPRTHQYTALEFADGLPPVLSVGDALPLVLAVYRCSGDECDLMTRTRPRAALIHWRAEPAKSVTITPAGVLRARRAGRVVVTATRAHRETKLALDILPPIARLLWRLVPSQPTVGDTVAVVIEAQDSTGRMLSRLAPAVQMGGTGYTGEVVRWAAAVGDSEATRVSLPAAGELALIVRVGPRADTLRRRIAVAR